MRITALAAGVLTIAASVAITNNSAVFGIGPGAPVVPAKAPVTKPISIDLDKAVPIRLPKFNKELKPEKFTTKDGKQGWALRISSERPIATPAYEDGLLFVGGGYGSHEFYAFNAETGALVWKYSTGDDGPTAAVVENGYVAFNTESCTVYCVHAKTGKLVWQEWLGDPLMSQPAMANGKLYIAYPAKNQTDEYTHRLLCADVKTGRHIWDQPITGDVISAPVIDGNEVLVTCLDGTSFCRNAQTGKLIWKKKNSGTSAPLVVGKQIIVTERETDKRGTIEHLRRLDKTAGTRQEKTALVQTKADYLSGSAGPLPPPMVAALDASVGFASLPGSAQLEKAASNIGVKSVAGAWAYQGSRAAYNDGHIMNAQGPMLNSVDAPTGKVAWQASVRGKNVGANEQLFAPPSLGKENMYLCSNRGHVVSVAQKTGNLNFAYSTDEPIAFQPALANGNLYAGTSNGLLICLKTGSADATGWSSWGGNAQHNKVK